MSLPFFVAACGGSKQAEVQPTHRGRYVGGDQLNTFAPCGEKQMYWVVGRASFVLQSQYRQMAHRPFQPLYIEIRGEVAPAGGQAPMEGHTGNIRVDTVLRAQTIMPVDCKVLVEEE